MREFFFYIPQSRNETAFYIDTLLREREERKNGARKGRKGGGEDGRILNQILRCLISKRRDFNDISNNLNKFKYILITYYITRETGALCNIYI